MNTIFLFQIEGECGKDRYFFLCLSNLFMQISMNFVCTYIVHIYKKTLFSPFLFLNSISWPIKSKNCLLYAKSSIWITLSTISYLMIWLEIVFFLNSVEKYILGIIFWFFFQQFNLILMPISIWVYLLHGLFYWWKNTSLNNFFQCRKYT